MEIFKDKKQYYSDQLSEYDLIRKIITKQYFAWRTNPVINNRVWIILKTKYKYQTRTNKFGIYGPE